jgi:hypothetical protein
MEAVCQNGSLMFDSFLVPQAPDINPALPGYRKFLLRHKRGLLLIFLLALMAVNILQSFVSAEVVKGD